MKILVTGASGMVGRNILAHARSSCYDILAPSRSELDLRDAEATTNWFRRHCPDAVIHAAGTVGGIQANINHPVQFVIDNVRIGVSLFTAARSVGVPKIINLGSSCMYPRDRQNALTPDDLLDGKLEPTNEGYALAKIVAWKIGAYMRREDPSLIYKTLIPCNLFGLYDHFDPVRSHLVPATIMKLTTATETGAREVEVWGDGTARREFMFASDLADFIWTFLPRLEELPDVMNVGIGTDRTVREYYEATARIVGYTGEFRFDAAKPVGMQRKLVDVSVQRQLGWQPRHSLEDGIALTVQHYQGLRSSNSSL